MISGDKGQEKSSGANDDSPSTLVGNVIVFHVNTTNEKDLQFVKDGLVERINDMIDALTIKDGVITVLDDNTIAVIRDLQTPDVAINIGISSMFRNSRNLFFCYV